MALNHITLDQSKQLGNQLRACRAQVSDARVALRNMKGVMKEFINGDGSQDTHYAPMVTAGVGATNAEAHSAYIQLDNLITALENNASQTAVFDKYEQFVNFLGGN